MRQRLLTVDFFGSQEIGDFELFLYACSKRATSVLSSYP